MRSQTRGRNHGEKGESPAFQAYEVTTEQCPTVDGHLTDVVRFKCKCCGKKMPWEHLTPQNCCAHWKTYPEICLSESKSINEAGCKDRKLLALIATKEAQETRALAAREVGRTSVTTITSIIQNSDASCSTAIHAGPKRNASLVTASASGSKKQKTMAPVTCGPAMASNAAIAHAIAMRLHIQGTWDLRAIFLHFP